MKITIEIEVEGYTSEQLRTVSLIQAAYDYSCLAPFPSEMIEEDDNCRVSSMTVSSPHFSPISFEEIKNHIL